ncbi:MAG TPA: HAMP domain-containing sensor histidine kinase [Chloroflexia bacterium]|nr:HAMP domain-containing sensor histidine kinase [Chloroflexia bacterium]
MSSNVKTAQRVSSGFASAGGPTMLLSTLEQLLAIEATTLDSALNRASTLIAEALDCEKSDIFLYEPSTDSLVARGTSNTPMGVRQHQLGLDREPLTNGGLGVLVFQTGEPHISGHVDRDPNELPGIRNALGVRSSITVPFVVAGERRGVLQVVSTQPDKFTQDDLSFIEAVAHWVGMVAQRAELVEVLTLEAAERASTATAEELIEVLAHDMNNYITPILGHISMLRQLARDEDNQRYFTHVEGSYLAVRRLRELVKDLLDIRRMQHGVFTLSVARFNLLDLVRETLETMQTTRLKVLLSVQQDVERAGELMIEADPARVRQALENLLSNALKYSPEGVPVSVMLNRQGCPDRVWAVITVQDEGPGIAPDVLPRLFTRYTTGAESTGLGLGLYLAHNIVEAHGGTLAVDTEAGRGATFRMSLPVVSTAT